MANSSGKGGGENPFHKRKNGRWKKKKGKLDNFFSSIAVPPPYLDVILDPLLPSSESVVC